jgi:eukaryotic-like serine/threonine-protein kinase
MPLASGSRLGPYEVIGPLGAGGMGEVYRARDTRLGRDVALKVLPAKAAGEAGRKARFEQEARAVAALNHPNIVGLYDAGAANGVEYIVTELVSGDTLATAMGNGALPVKKVLDIAVQIADGMAAAHAAGITHRDLKPANVMIAGDGRVKILDFGLARQAAAGVGNDHTVTAPGMILGTVQYMSPEQARGKAVDYRSDQFSFGLILYEMAAGRKAFEREESVQVMSAILTEEPPPIARELPVALRWVIERCLAKDPAERYESSRDLYQDLRNLRDHLSEASAITAMVAPSAAPARRRKYVLPAAAFALGVAAAAAFFLTRGRDVPDQSAYRFTPFSFEASGPCCAAWSPDGKAIAYSASMGAQPYQVFLRYLGSPTPVQLTHGTENARVAQWTPDGKRILFRREGMKPEGLSSVATVGGEPEFTIPSSDMGIATLSPDTKVHAALREEGGRYGIFLSSPPGSPAKRYLPDPFATREIYNRPQIAFSPDGKQILLYVNGERRREEAWLMSYPPDTAHPPRRILEGVRPFNGTPEFSWMPDNRHIVLSLAPDDISATQLWLADTTTGKLQALTSGTTSYSSPAASPDGKRILFSELSGNYDIVTVDLATAAAHTLLATARDEAMPAWASRQPVLVFVTDRNGPQEIWLHGPGNSDRPLVQAKDLPRDSLTWLMGPALSPEADRVIYTRFDRGPGEARLWISAVSGGEPLALTNDKASEFPGSWSPDGSSFVYQAIRGGRMDLLKVKTSGQAAPVLLKENIQPDSGGVPCWSPTGDWIAYNDHGVQLTSPDGQKTKALGDLKSRGCMFSADGKLLYGIRPDHDRTLLFSVSIASGAEKIIGDIGKDFVPRSRLNPAIRFSLTPDGKSFVYSTGTTRNDLWLLEGFAGR